MSCKTIRSKRVQAAPNISRELNVGTPEPARQGGGGIQRLEKPSNDDGIGRPAEKAQNGKHCIRPRRKREQSQSAGERSENEGAERR